MSINRVKTTGGEQSFNFLTNQSSILHTVDTNKITVNGVNVIVDKPKRGDVMCITKYRKENGDLLEADKQKVIWIDGLSIEPTQLLQELEPVGICLIVKGNKAIVRYREERAMIWAASTRFEFPNSPIMNDGVEHTLEIRYIEEINNPIPLNPISFVFTASSRAEFVDKLNKCFLENGSNYSAELVELDIDLPAVDTSDDKDGENYHNRVIVNPQFTVYPWHNSLYIQDIGSGTDSLAKHISKSVDWYYKNNGFKNYRGGGCCRAGFYDYYQTYGQYPSAVMTSIDSDFPVSLNDFTYNTNCKFLRDNFATYDEYLESMMVKFPCGADGAITEFPSGKADTYKLANCTFLDNTAGKQEALYPAANWAASIDLNAPKLGKGNWWLPSPAEMVEIMRDITYGTSFWETNPDIINSVLAKLTSIDNGGWSILDTTSDRWTSSLYNYYSGWSCGDTLRSKYFNVKQKVSPITIYEF